MLAEHETPVLSVINERYAEFSEFHRVSYPNTCVHVHRRELTLVHVWSAKSGGLRGIWELCRFCRPPKERPHRYVPQMVCARRLGGGRSRRPSTGAPTARSGGPRSAPTRAPTIHQLSAAVIIQTKDETRSSPPVGAAISIDAGTAGAPGQVASVRQL